MAIDQSNSTGTVQARSVVVFAADAVSIEFEMTHEDVEAWFLGEMQCDTPTRTAFANARRRARAYYVAAGTAFALGGALVWMSAYRSQPSSLFRLQNVALFIGLVCAAGAWFDSRTYSLARWRRRCVSTAHSAESATELNPMQLLIDRAGIRITWPAGEFKLAWSGVGMVYPMPDFVCIHGARREVLAVVPNRVFSDPSQPKILASRAQAWLDEAGSEWWRAIRTYLHQGKATCPGCGYDMRGSEFAVCPECGRALGWDDVRAAGRSRSQP